MSGPGGKDISTDQFHDLICLLKRYVNYCIMSDVFEHGYLQKVLDFGPPGPKDLNRQLTRPS